MTNTLTYRGSTFTDSEIISGSSSRAQSLDMRELTVDAAQFTLRVNSHFDFWTNEPYPFFTRDGYRFQTSETNPLADGVVQNAQIKQYINDVQIAVWLVKSIDRLGAEIYRISAVSPLGLLTQRTHYGGIYTGEPAAAVIADLMGDTAYYIAPEFQNIALYGWLPIAAARDNLMQVLFAINAALATDSDGTLRIENISAAKSLFVGMGDIYASGASVEYLAPVTRVVVLEHQFVVGSESKKLFEGTTSQGQMITFGEPTSNLQADGFTIMESNANYAVVSGGSGTLTGTPYIDTTREVSRDVTSATTENEVRIEKATLVGITASADVAKRLQEYYKHRDSVKVSVANKLPRGVITVYDPYAGELVDACVDSAELNISAVEKTGISALIGFTPWQTVPFEDVQVVITENGTVTIPEDVENVTAVIIGGGSGGEKGEDGASALNGSFSTGGIGGAGGIGGSGGKILYAQINTQEVKSFLAIIGKGGSPGSVGLASSFGEYSSDSGESSPSGYYDPVKKELYAFQGENGIRGGDGGTQNSNGGDVSYNEETYFGGFPGASVRGRISGYAYGGSGGGAAVGANGKNGTPGLTEYNNGYGFNNAGSGGSGGNAINRQEVPTIPGCGGFGGHGGGGGGGSGSATGSATYTWSSGQGGNGGTGGSGGTGADGCIILYYRRPAAT